MKKKYKANIKKSKIRKKDEVDDILEFLGILNVEENKNDFNSSKNQKIQIHYKLILFVH